ncbi:MAG: hydroxymethylglutaryl-CoA reductase [Thermoplasmata archaeon]
MVSVPSFILKKLYVKGSLKNSANGFLFELKNTLAEATIVSPIKIAIDGKELNEKNIYLNVGKEKLNSSEISQTKSLKFMVGTSIILEISGINLSPGQHKIDIRAQSKEFGELSFSIQDNII